MLDVDSGVRILSDSRLGVLNGSSLASVRRRYSVDLRIWLLLAVVTSPRVNIVVGTKSEGLIMVGWNSAVVRLDITVKQLSRWSARRSYRGMQLVVGNGRSHTIELVQGFPLILVGIRIMHDLGGMGVTRRSLASQLGIICE